MNRKVIIAWAFCVGSIFALLLFIGFNMKDKVYASLEKNLISITKEYIKDKNINLNFNDSTVVFVSELEKEEYIKDDNIKKYCIDNIVFTKGLIFDDYKVVKKCGKE